MGVIEKSWSDFWAYYWRVTQRSKNDLSEYDNNVVSLIETRCHLKPPQRILDLGCGHGIHSFLLAQKGYSVVGIDISKPLIDYADKEFGLHSKNRKYIQNDMRRISYSNEFDVCTLLSGTFGFFSENENRELLQSINKSLSKNGYIFIMYISSNRTDLNSKNWVEIDNGYQLSQTWFEQETSTFHSTIKLLLNNGDIIIPMNEKGYHANEAVRCYTPPEITSLLTNSGYENITHLRRKHISDPNSILKSDEIREIVLAQKA